MQNPYFNSKASLGPIFLRACLSFSFILASFVQCAQNSYATNFDLGNAAYDEAQARLSAGTGMGQIGPQTGNTNVSFKDFGVVPDSDPRSIDASNPADLLPINHQNTVDGMNVYSYQSAGTYQVAGNKLIQSGTSYSQAPRLNPEQINRQFNPFQPGSTSTLPPTSSALQSTHMPTAFVPIPSGQYSFGFQPAPYNMYQGPYGQPFVINPMAGFSLNNLLPPTSLGSVDFNIRSR